MKHMAEAKKLEHKPLGKENRVEALLPVMETSYFRLVSTYPTYGLARQHAGCGYETKIGVYISDQTKRIPG